MSVIDALAGVAITTPAGRELEKLRFVAASDDAVLSIVNVNVVMSP